MPEVPLTLTSGGRFHVRIPSLPPSLPLFPLKSLRLPSEPASTHALTIPHESPPPCLRPTCPRVSQCRFSVDNQSVATMLPLLGVCCGTSPTPLRPHALGLLHVVRSTHAVD